jgi:hypothetical protein
MRKANVALFVLALALFAVPAFASNDDAALNFQALSDIAADTSAPTMLSDDQLAAVEGGNHLTTGVSQILFGYILANQQPLVVNAVGQALLRAFATASIGAGSFVINSVPVHPCGAAAGVAC